MVAYEITSSGEPGASQFVLFITYLAQVRRLAQEAYLPTLNNLNPLII